MSKPVYHAFSLVFCFAIRKNAGGGRTGRREERFPGQILPGFI
ncbi:hypothetical protein ASZ90_010312 [hydrocarbon metagenome]|uniref:Uncharacterized protein n=1 Tax=hydrocarbon metagenome TaxID=938273 RepID=A0A0W8FGG2_9ZZZZ